MVREECERKVKFISESRSPKYKIHCILVTLNLGPDLDLQLDFSPVGNSKHNFRFQIRPMYSIYRQRLSNHALCYLGFEGQTIPDLEGDLHQVWN
jgi:hypothetical protein